ncbi:hypothetical protein ACRRTK_010385 [Alexandromys fortis]
METLEEKATGEKHRTLLCQGPVELRRGWRRKKQHLSLFSDVLVVSDNLRKRKFKTKHVIPLSYLWMGDSVDIVGRDSSSACKSILLSWPMGNFVATFRVLKVTNCGSVVAMRKPQAYSKSMSIPMTL